MRRSLLSLVALLAVVAPACSAFGTAPAATVRGTEITTDSIRDELKTIMGNEPYRQVLEQSYGSPVTDEASKGTFDAAFTAQILSLRVWYEMIEQDLDRRGIEVTDAVVAQAGTDIRNQFAQLGPDVFESFPTDYQERLTRQRALVAAIDRDITAEIGDDPEAFYEEHPEEFAEICVSHALVGLQGGRSPEEARAKAQRLYERIEDGEDFETIATEESDDPGSAQQAGFLGCGSKLQLQFDPVFLKAAYSLEEGEVSEPVLTQFGAHLILVSERTVPPFSEVEFSAETVMLSYHDQAINDYLVEVICDTEVSVNPRYGSWAIERCEGPAPQLPAVQPPEGPRRVELEGLEPQL